MKAFVTALTDGTVVLLVVRRLYELCMSVCAFVSVSRLWKTRRLGACMSSICANRINIKMKSSHLLAKQGSVDSPNTIVITSIFEALQCLLWPLHWVNPYVTDLL